MTDKKPNVKPSLAIAIIRTFGFKFLLSGIILFVEDCVFK